MKKGEQMGELDRAKNDAPDKLSTRGIRNEMRQIFSIQKEEQELIEAAIRLGDWVSAQKEITKEQTEGIKDLQAALRRLPEVTYGLCAAYGFSANDISVEGWDGTGPVPEGEMRSWEVSYYQSRDIGGKIVAIIEIYNIVNPYPRMHYEELAGYEMELIFFKQSFQPILNGGEQLSKLTDWDIARISDWVTAVSSPDTYRKDGVSFEVEVDKWIPEWLSSGNQKNNA